MKIFVSLFLLFGFSFSQSLLDPPAGFSGATAPCGTGAFTVTTEIEEGRFFPVSWLDDDNVNNNDPVTFSILDGTGTGANVLATLNTFNFNTGNNGATNNAFVRVPSGILVTNQTYVLQYNRANTDYSCAQVLLNADTLNVTAIALGVNAGPFNVSAGEIDYYEYQILNGNPTDLYYFVGGSGTPGQMTIIANRGLPNVPVLGQSDESTPVQADGTWSLGFCFRNDQFNDGYAIAVVGSPSAMEAPYDLSIGSYDPEINIDESINSAQHSGNRYFRTGSFSNIDPNGNIVTRSILLEGEAEGTWLMTLNTQNRNCDFTPSNSQNLMPSTQISATQACVELPNQDRVRNFRVEGPTPSIYTVSVRVGGCDEFDNGASSLLASFVFPLVFSVLLF